CTTWRYYYSTGYPTFDYW
nr:immunoglobulin heavy chain junction region [Macaca mulatta]MOX62114.1 immunoglobulin heavy chain junction region [Macaca mulatta]MOX62212.1 immunoglobulin heavy chain junction region [Macaca mulatta]MOX62735.1 immunoglobulin heavy chain junction region [Macaca mulatta]MOX64203.1 immunoglobulin heavy chain junction region [Macaca mulatta]